MISGLGSKKGVRLTKIHAMHRGEASGRSVQLFEQNRQEKERAAEEDEEEPAAKPPGTPFSIDK
eukprot:9422018-Pyramimonas_sp.AAC.1